MSRKLNTSTLALVIFLGAQAQALLPMSKPKPNMGNPQYIRISENSVDFGSVQEYALELIDSAKNVRPNPIYDLIYKTLKSMSINTKNTKNLKEMSINTPPAGGEWDDCTTTLTVRTGNHTVRSGAAMFEDKKRIYICRESLSDSTEALAEKLIHETAHVAGYDDECDATKIEFSIIGDAGLTSIGVPLFEKECNIRPNFRLRYPYIKRGNVRASVHTAR